MKNVVNLKSTRPCSRHRHCVACYCPELGCEYRTKQKSDIKQHRANVHDIEARLWFCDYEGCEHRVKENGAITKHKAHKHNIGVHWKECHNCDYKAKTNSSSQPAHQEPAHQEPAHIQVRCDQRGVTGAECSKTLC